MLFLTGTKLSLVGVPHQCLYDIDKPGPSKKAKSGNMAMEGNEGGGPPRTASLARRGRPTSPQKSPQHKNKEAKAYSWMASEMGQDVGEAMSYCLEGSLLTHPLEHMMTLTEVLLPEDDDIADDNIEYLERFVRLLEVYIDMFIQLAQTTNPNKLLHLSRAVPRGIHLVFPPPSVTGHAGEDPVSPKKGWSRVMDVGEHGKKSWVGYLMAHSAALNSPAPPPTKLSR
jgi:hypothetical protein